jgi:hypothetical protein
VVVLLVGLDPLPIELGRLGVSSLVAEPREDLAPGDGDRHPEELLHGERAARSPGLGFNASRATNFFVLTRQLLDEGLGLHFSEPHRAA